MINVKSQVYSALKGVADNVTDIYPTDWAKLPAVQYTEESNIVRTKTDEKEQISYLRYRIDIWDNASTSELTLQVDAAVSALGLTRIECQDVADPSGMRHKQLRYEGSIDVTSEIVYWENSQ